MNSLLTMQPLQWPIANLSSFPSLQFKHTHQAAFITAIMNYRRYSVVQWSLCDMTENTTRNTCTQKKKWSRVTSPFALALCTVTHHGAEVLVVQ